MCSFVGASLIWSCWMSVLIATKSTCVIPASIIRSSAFRPAPPTPMTRITARYDVLSRARSRRAGFAGRGSSHRAAGRSGSGVTASSGSRVGSGVGAGGGVSSGGRASGSGSDGFSPARPRWAASVARKSSASGPSRILARFLATEHLLRQVAVELGCLAVGLVGQHGRARHGCLRITDRLPDSRVEDQLAEVLAQDLVGLAGVREALVVHR